LIGIWKKAFNGNHDRKKHFLRRDFLNSAVDLPSGGQAHAHWGRHVNPLLFYLLIFLLAIHIPCKKEYVGRKVYNYIIFLRCK
jgi:hypothetical protein